MKPIITIFLALAITGCASNPITTTETREAATQIKPGWTMAQVDALMGKPVGAVVSGDVQTNTYNTIK
jgi:outer membrane protein assembly factor BamE (lipoprotein component of BamABCDE complex)